MWTAHLVCFQSASQCLRWKWNNHSHSIILYFRTGSVQSEIRSVPTLSEIWNVVVFSVISLCFLYCHCVFYNIVVFSVMLFFDLQGHRRKRTVFVVIMLSWSEKCSRIISEWRSAAASLNVNHRHRETAEGRNLLTLYMQDRGLRSQWVCVTYKSG